MGKSRKRPGAPKYKPKKRLRYSRQGICDSYALQIQTTWNRNAHLPGIDDAIFLLANGASGKQSKIWSTVVCAPHWDLDTAHEVIVGTLSDYEHWGTTSYPHAHTIEAFVNGMLDRLKADSPLDARVKDTAIVAVHPEGAAAFGFLATQHRTSLDMRKMVCRALDLKISLAKRI